METIGGRVIHPQFLAENREWPHLLIFGGLHGGGWRLWLETDLRRMFHSVTTGGSGLNFANEQLQTKVPIINLFFIYRFLPLIIVVSVKGEQLFLLAGRIALF